jgi:hypothetical protein
MDIRPRADLWRTLAPDSASLVSGFTMAPAPYQKNRMKPLLVLFVFTLASMPAPAQDQGKKTDKTSTNQTDAKKTDDASKTKEKDKPATPDKTANLQGTVKGAACSTPPCGTATLTLSDNPTEQRVSPIDMDGKYQFAAVPAKKYRLRIEVAGFVVLSDSIDLSAGGDLRHDVAPAPLGDCDVMPDTSWTNRLGALAFLIIYLSSILITRWFKIAKPSHNFLLAQIAAVRTRFITEVVPNPTPEQTKNIENLVEQLKLVEAKYTGPFRWVQFLFWSQSAENADWVTIHEIERELTAYLAPEELVHTRLIVASAKLRSLSPAAAKALADQIDHELAASAPNSELRRRLLAEASNLINDDRDTNFTTLMDWQNKATWLILISCLLIIVMGHLGGNVILFLAGAAGGLVSRLMRAIQRQDVPIDYGASWTSLFLSPLYGAVSGWFGIALITLLSNPQIGLLGRVFTFVKWCGPLTVPTMAVAFILGFSERLFSAVADALEQQAAKTPAPAGAQAPKVPPPPLAPPPPPPPPGGQR